MLDRLLQAQLEPIVERYRQRQLSIRLARCYGLAGLVGLGFLWLFTWGGWVAWWLAPLLAFGGFAAGRVERRRSGKESVGVGEIAHELEWENPRLHALLLTAVEQRGDSATGDLGFLQERVVREVLEYNRRHPLGHRSYEHLFFARAAHWGALAGFVLVLGALYAVAPVGTAALRADMASFVEVTPGDASVERGDSLVVLARFGRRLPAEAALVVTPTEGEALRLPLTRNLDDPVFGGRIADIRGELVYRVEYEGEVTPAYRVTVFDLPRLERADAHLEYPGYTGLEGKVIENTRRVTAVEGTRVRYVFELNKPVTSAAWVERDQPPILLAQAEGRSNVMALDFTLDRSARYSLQLVDDAGRTNRAPPEFFLEVFTNRAPELKLAAPRGDDRVSPLEEVTFRAWTSDDFGVRAYGLGYRIGAGEIEVVELGGPAGRNERREFGRVLPLESLALRPGQLLTYFLWAEDAGPEGLVRRSYSDIYFLEVRPFDEIFRENQSGESGAGSQAQGQGSPSERLAELQKQIIAATWTLQHRATPKPPPGFGEDTEVLRESQEHVLDQAAGLAEQVNDPTAREWMETARTEMERAIARLEQAKADESAGPLAEALGAEQAAYEALLQLQSREYEVARSQGGQGGGSRSGRMQRQLNQLQMKASEDRYETQRQATPQVDEQQREQLQFLARLKELAQRQQDLNERLRELELALQEARTDQEREEVRRQLQRLREEQQAMLSDVDELSQRMDRPENQTRTAEARQQLEEARSQLQRAAEAMEQGAVSQAAASGARASRQLEELREDIRTRNASEFAEVMRQMRREARELLERQESLAEQMALMAENQRPSLSDALPREDLARQAAQQTVGLTNLLDRVRQVTEESEAAEPLLSRDLYETFRQAVQDDAANLREVTEELLRQGALTRPVYDLLRFPGTEGPGQSLATTERLLREGHLPAAQALEEKAREDLTGLARGIDRAAESILGDDTEALRLAQSELEELLAQLEGEIAEGRATSPSTLRPPSPPGRQQAEGGETPASQPFEAGGGERRAGSGGESPARELAEGGRSDRGDDRQGVGGEGLFFESAGANEIWGTGGGGRPLTGPAYRDWLDRLGEVEELLDSPDLRLEVGRVRERAQSTRAEYKRRGKLPQWDVVELEMATPLGEVRDRLGEELARRQSPEALVPIDRDLVPPRYSELVRRYYENLGRSD